MITLQAHAIYKLLESKQYEELNKYCSLEINKLTYNIITSDTIGLFNICDTNPNLTEEEIHLIINECPINLLFVLLYKQNMQNHRMQILRKGTPEYLYSLCVHINNIREEEIIYALDNINDEEFTLLYMLFNSTFKQYYETKTQLSDKVINDIDFIYILKETNIIDNYLLNDILNRSSIDNISIILNNINSANVLFIYEYLFFNKNLTEEYKKNINKIALNKCLTKDISKIYFLIDNPNNEELEIIINRCDRSFAFLLFTKIKNISKRDADKLRNKYNSNNIFDINIHLSEEELVIGYNNASNKEEYLFINIDNPSSKLLLSYIKKEIAIKLIYLYNLYNPSSIDAIVKIIKTIDNMLLPEIFKLYNKPSLNEVLEMTKYMNGDNQIILKKYILESNFYTKDELKIINEKIWNYYFC
jgi:hypothetical protein